MKTLLLIICLSAAAFARADVTVTESARVLKNGHDIGAVPDAIKNGVVTPSEVQTALLKLIVSLKADKDVAQTAAIQAASDKQKLVDAVGKDDKKAIADAVKTEKQRRKDEAQAKIDAATAELKEASK